MRALLYALLALGTTRALAEPLNFLLTNPRLWEMSPEKFVSSAQEDGFRFTSPARDSARAAHPGLSAFTMRVTEAVAHFEGDKVKDIVLTFYARSLPPDLTEHAFRNLVANALLTISAATNLQHTVRGKEAGEAVKAEGLIWQNAHTRYVLEYSFTKEVKSRGQPFRPEFVRLEITPAVKSPALASGAAKPAAKKFVGAEHVQRDEASGDVWIKDVPVVVQGGFGYSILTCSERVMRHCGFDVDKQELAQAANASFESSLSYSSMLDALKRIGARQRFRVREIHRYDSGEFRRMLLDYNRAAKRLSAPPIAEPKGSWKPNDIYPLLRFEVLREARTKNKADLSRFMRQAQAAVEEGIPPLWCIISGLNAGAGERREIIGATHLLIGYNLRTQEIIYHDGLNSTSERKRMSLADAWTVTNDLFTIEPF